MNRKPIFDIIRVLLDRGFHQAEVDAVDRAIDTALASLPANLLPAPPSPPPPASPNGRALGEAGKNLIKAWEGCERRRADGRFDAYPDPGSGDGHPWTIGWGSTGADVKRGTIWTQAQCDARFDQDILVYVNEVAGALGDAPTTQSQFDALVSFHYNTGAIATATLTRLHKQGRFAEAKEEFGRWIYNNRKPMNGLKRRRAAEAALYGTAA